MPHPKGWDPSVPKMYWDPLYPTTVRPTATKFVMITHVGQEHISWGQPHPYLKGAGAQHFLKIFEPLHMPNVH